MRGLNHTKGIFPDKLFRISISLILSVLLFQMNTYPKETQPDTTGLLEGVDDGSGFMKQYKARAGLTPGISLPLGDLGTALGMGYGADIFADVLLPYNIADNILLRAGINIGFYSFTTKNDISASLTTIPFLVNAKLIYPLAHGFSPYAGPGFGLTTNMASGDVSASSYDGTVAVNFGTGYLNEALPEVEFFLDMRYMMAFETVTGQFFNILIGAGYRFDTASTANAAQVIEPAEVPSEGEPEGEKPVYKESSEEKFPPQESIKLR